MTVSFGLTAGRPWVTGGCGRTAKHVALTLWRWSRPRCGLAGKRVRSTATGSQATNWKLLMAPVTTGRVSTRSISHGQQKPKIRLTGSGTGRGRITKTTPSASSRMRTLTASARFTKGDRAAGTRQARRSKNWQTSSAARSRTSATSSTTTTEPDRERKKRDAAEATPPLPFLIEPTGHGVVAPKPVSLKFLRRSLTVTLPTAVMTA